MPLFPNLAELKGLANSFNPLNVFAEQPASTATTTTNPPSSPSDAISPRTAPAPQFPASPSASAGPGPSTQAAAKQRASTLVIPQSGSRPIRPSLKNGTSSMRNGDSSSTSSLEDEAGRRRSSGASVVIIDPHDEERDLRAAGIDGLPRRNPRTMSAVSGLSSVPSDMARRKKKVPMDTYILVRPPPTSNKNPMNLQIQLVVKETRTRDRSISGVSLRSASISTDATTSTSAPTTPTSPAIDLPPPDSISQVVDIGSSSEIKSPRADSPTRMSSSDDNDIELEPPVASNLKRSSSLKSSLSSNTSGTSSTLNGSRKRVEPMFNLAVHNVMHPTVVTDAATDAKVAKFLKRSLDVNGVGILEPSEVWLPPSNTNSFTALPGSALRAEAHPPTRSRPVSMVSTLTAPLSPTSTRLSDSGTVSNIRNSLDLTFKRTSMDLKNARLEVAQEGGAKKFFGKMFKKKSPADLGGQTAESRRSISLAVKRSPSPASENGEGSSMTIKGHAGHGAALDSHHHSVGHPTFGTAPMVIHRRSSGTIITPDGAVTGLTAPSGSAPAAGLGTSPESTFSVEKNTTLPMLPSSRPVGYTWSVKKWAKKNTDGWAAHLVAAASSGLELVHGTGGDCDDEVIFEWVKLRVPSNAVGTSIIRKYSSNGAIEVTPGSRPKAGRSKSRTASIRDGALVRETDSCLNVATPDLHPTSLPPSPNPSIDARPRPVRRISASVSPAPARRSASTPPSISEHDADHDASSVHTHDLTAEEDSDPEDSETPWTCSIWVKKTGQRQLLGTLTPAPHHPKVVAALKIPRSLEPVSLAQVKEGTGMIQKEMASRVRQEVCLTEENLKDVVCVTAMWLVAREEFNGLGRKKRGGSKV